MPARSKETGDWSFERSEKLPATPLAIDSELWRNIEAVAWITHHEFARRAGVDAETVRRHAQAGRLPAITADQGPGNWPNRVWLLPADEVAHYAAHVGTKGRPNNGRQSDKQRHRQALLRTLEYQRSGKSKPGPKPKITEADREAFPELFEEEAA